MNCERIQDIILTDYLDGELGAENIKQIEAHTASCIKCREFLAAARQTTEPFSASQKIELPRDQIWKRIEAQIKSSRPPEAYPNPLFGLFAKLKQALASPKPAFALSFAVVVVLVTSIYLRSVHQAELARQASEENGEQYLVYVADELSETFTDESEDYGIDIEQYFL